MTTILIVDDHAGFRADARAVLEASGYDVVGEARDAADAITAIDTLHPAIVLVDVQLPGRDGFALADEIAAREPAPQIVLISSREATDYGSRVTRSAARGFIHKPSLSRHTLEALIGDR